ncbi:MAG TPA: hypothetical protein H9717_11580 [Candidatus Eisenbergiella merdipullorum]|uniref:SGNH hydrolase-type esterase domain-containing protein n=1 Tax=Candidatus Eisenbergiella merdipullorum TaxID=2838553 RepID=A0A9D2L0J5_9FIRM|nr:hypothetical protein [Candidatus Eisenbergiella merdipullorum]
MKLYGKKIRRLLAILCIVTMVLSACGSRTEITEQETGTEEDLQARIQALEEENAQLRAQLEQYTGTEPQPSESQTGETESASTKPEETETAQETETQAVEEPPQEDRLNIVVFGDSIWDMDRTETGIAAQVAGYMNANVYNCAIGGTRATLKPGESDVNYDTWDSTSLTGMCYVMRGMVDTNFLEGYPAGGVIRNVNPAAVDYYIIAYGLNDYFSGAPISVSDGDTFDPHGYTGALNNALELLKGASPNAKFLLISPTYCQFYENGYMVTDSNMKNYGQGTLSDYANACRNVAEMKQTLYIDAYSTMGINGYTAEEYLEDGVHLTEAGRTLYARAVSSCLKYGKPGEVSGNSVYY